MGFDYMAFEVDSDYFKAAAERIECHKAQGNLFREERKPTIIENVQIEIREVE